MWEILLWLVVWAGILGPFAAHRAPGLSSKAAQGLLCWSPPGHPFSLGTAHTDPPLLCYVPNLRKSFDLLTLLSHWHAPATMLPLMKSFCSPGFWNKKARLHLPLYSFLDEMQSEPGICLMRDQREGKSQEERREANTLHNFHLYTLSEGLTIRVVFND